MWDFSLMPVQDRQVVLQASTIKHLTQTGVRG